MKMLKHEAMEAIDSLPNGDEKAAMTLLLNYIEEQVNQLRQTLVLQTSVIEKLVEIIRNS